MHNNVCAVLLVLIYRSCFHSTVVPPYRRLMCVCVCVCVCLSVCLFPTPRVYTLHIRTDKNSRQQKSK
jgi:hypothetical protein